MTAIEALAITNEDHRFPFTLDQILNQIKAAAIQGHSYINIPMKSHKFNYDSISKETESKLIELGYKLIKNNIAIVASWA